MQWELHQVSDMECTPDSSGVYVTIHRVSEEITHKGIKGSLVSVRADLWQSVNEETDTPLVSFVGTANAVRKHLIRFLDRAYVTWAVPVSLEHASYIGYELHRAEVTENYVQE